MRKLKAYIAVRDFNKRGRHGHASRGWDHPNRSPEARSLAGHLWRLRDDDMEIEPEYEERVADAAADAEDPGHGGAVDASSGRSLAAHAAASRNADKCVDEPALDTMQSGGQQLVSEQDSETGETLAGESEALIPSV